MEEESAVNARDDQFCLKPFLSEDDQFCLKPFLSDASTADPVSVCLLSNDKK